MPGLFNASKSKTKEDEEIKSGGLFKSNKTVTEQPKGSSGGLFKPSTVNINTSPLDKYKTDNPFDTAATEKSIINAKLRIKSAGGSVVEDKRNKVEKLLNLPQGQPWGFDALEILGRPQQALFGGINATLKNENSDKAFMDGLKGNKVVRGSNLIESMGIKNKPTRAVGGFVVDVATDPLNVLPINWLGKAASLTGKGVKAVGGGIEKAVPAIKTLRETKITPKLESGKDALGNVFVPKYKWNETLSGTKDDFLKNKYIETENAIQYQSEEALKNVANAARNAGGIDTGTDVGRLMEKDLVINGPRPARQYSTDPKVLKAADDLMKSNDSVRQWAIANDIPVGEIEGYMRHILSAEETAARKMKKPSVVDRPMSGMNNPDKKVLNNRTLQGSVEDINDEIGRKFFEPNAYFSTAVGQKKLIEYGNAVKFRREVLSNTEFAKPYVKGSIKPEGTEIINTNNYKFLHDPTNAGLVDEIGGDYVVTPAVKMALDRYNKLTSDKGINSFLKAYDTVQSGWKKLTLLSMPYHIRNDVGAKFNNYVAGMNPIDITNYSSKATNDVINALGRGKETPLFTEFRKQGLGSNSQMSIEFARHGNDAEKAMRSIVEDKSRTALQKSADIINPFKIFKNSQDLGTAVDQINRFSLYKWARESQGLSPEQAAAKVKEVQFDYTDLTNAEREIFTRIIPFYRWSRKNIPFQLNQLVKSPMKYANVNKLKESSQDYFGIEEDKQPEYMRNNWAFPVSGDGKGSGRLLGLNLPVADLSKITTPNKFFSDSLSPLIKLPIELSTNRNLYNGKEIEEFAGQQKKLKVPETMYGINMPGGGKYLGGLSTKAAHSINQLGGVPARDFFKSFGVKTEQDKENAALRPTFGILDMFKKYDINETNYYAKKKELRELMDYIDFLEQENGVRPKSVTDIKKGR